jgi:hypothetical protein
MPYFNTIQGLRSEGFSLQDIWGELHAAEEAGGPIIAGASIFDMNFMVGRADQINRASDAMAAAPLENAIDSTMWAWAPWSGPAPDTNAFERFQIRFQVDTTTTDPGSPLWMQTTWEGPLEGFSIADIVNDSTFVAQSALDQYDPDKLMDLGLASGGTITGIGDIQIMRF